MFSLSAEYASRAVVCLAAHPGDPLTTHQIAAATRIPVGYLAKILQSLVKAGLVASQRGINGGFVLARPPQDLTLLDVVQVTDGSGRVTECPLGLAEHKTELCPLHKRLDEAAASAEQALGSATIAQLLSASEARPTPPQSADAPPVPQGSCNGPVLSNRENFVGTAGIVGSFGLPARRLARFAHFAKGVGRG